jgi:hypothetical protein
MVVIGAYWSSNLSIDFGEVNEGLVEVFDGFGSIFSRFVADIAYAAMGKELDVGDWESGKVFAHIGFGEPGWQSAHEYPRRL